MIRSCLCGLPPPGADPPREHEHREDEGADGRGGRRVVEYLGDGQTPAGQGAGVAELVTLAALGLFVHGIGIGVWDVAMNVEAAEVERRLERTVMPRFHAGWSVGSIAGAAVGIVEADALLGPDRVRAGDAVVAMASTHSMREAADAVFVHRNTLLQRVEGTLVAVLVANQTVEPVNLGLKIGDVALLGA